MNRRKPVEDLVTGQRYDSLASCGRALYSLVGGDPDDPYVWYKSWKLSHGDSGSRPMACG